MSGGVEGRGGAWRERGRQVWLFGPQVQRVRVEIEPGSAPEASDEVERVWEEMRAENPRLYSAGVLDVRGVDVHAGVVRAARDWYQRLVVQPRVQTGVNQLSVIGVCVAADGRGRDHVLLGKRGADTRIYGGMWHLAPAGGLEPPREESARELRWEELLEQLGRELEEEAGLSLAGARVRPLGFSCDPVAHSYDVLVGVEFGTLREPRGKQRWEHMELRWVAVEEMGGFVKKEQVIEASVVVMRGVGWM